MDKRSDGKFFEFETWLARDNFVLDFIKLIQISEVVFEPGGQIYEHIQCCNEITYVVSGEGFIYTNDNVMQVRSGDVHIISKGERHKIVAGPHGKLRYICMGYEFVGEPENFKKVCTFYAHAPEYTVSAQSDVRYLFNMLINEFYVEKSCKNEALENIVKLILIKTYRDFIKGGKESEYEKKSAFGGVTVYKITRYIDSNIYDVKSVREIASALGFTENYISHTFKTNMEISLSAYIKKKKTEAALGLIENKSMSFTDIAELLRFDSVQSFSRAFKQEYGMTPTQYKAEKENSK